MTSSVPSLIAMKLFATWMTSSSTLPPLQTIGESPERYSRPSAPTNYSSNWRNVSLRAVMVQPPFFPFSSLSPFVCAPPHLCHLLTPSDLIHLPSATSTPTLRCTHATMLCPHLD